VGAARPTQPVTLYVTVDITPEEAIQGRTQSPSLEHPLPLSHHQPVEAGNNKSQSREEASPTSTKDLRLALDQADQDMKRIDRLNTWQEAVGKIKWVMDTLSPIAEVRVIPQAFDVLD
jgi:hypothetical protein